MGMQLIADGPTRYLGGSIMTFALPYGAFIIIALGLFYFFKRPHSVPRMMYLRPAHQTSVGTREPGGTAVISVRGPIPAGAATSAQTTVPGGQPPNAAPTEGDPDHPSAAEGEK